MDRLIFTANATIREMATARQVLVNELANVSTVGFKSSYDVALQSVKVKGEGFDTRMQAQAVSRDLVRLTPGSIMATGRPTDVALAGAAVLTVQAPNGDLAFTRRGDLRVNINGQLETGTGHLVLGQGGPIAIPPGLLVSINSDGSVYARDPNQPPNVPAQQVGQLGLRDASQVSLARREDGLFRLAEQPPGTDFPSGPELPTLIPQALEGSNISAIEAMTRLLDHSRTFESQIRIIKETKTLDESSSTMMRNS